MLIDKKEELEILNEKYQEIRNNPEKGTELARKAGILDENNELTDYYKRTEENQDYEEELNDVNNIIKSFTKDGIKDSASRISIRSIYNRKTYLLEKISQSKTSEIINYEISEYFEPKPNIKDTGEYSDFAGTSLSTLKYWSKTQEDNWTEWIPSKNFFRSKNAQELLFYLFHKYLGSEFNVATRPDGYDIQIKHKDVEIRSYHYNLYTAIVYAFYQFVIIEKEEDNENK